MRRMTLLTLLILALSSVTRVASNQTWEGANRELGTIFHDLFDPPLHLSSDFIDRNEVKQVSHQSMDQLVADLIESLPVDAHLPRTRLHHRADVCKIQLFHVDLGRYVRVELMRIVPLGRTRVQDRGEEGELTALYLFYGIRVRHDDFNNTADFRFAFLNQAIQTEIQIFERANPGMQDAAFQRKFLSFLRRKFQLSNVQGPSRVQYNVPTEVNPFDYTGYKVVRDRRSITG
ncbi:hypothetical protein IE53DRAFT_384092 [Violaceomyces palustris]|uniref:Uncharacterized protein n=1 Tax=Violaceomyces palustris TaxID=1673888 RepID=A0ACD0P5H4_9BASI|nr:hypothetical protein IE53DRAFT_384092 [Violaceomyces palustris]